MRRGGGGGGVTARAGSVGTNSGADAAEGNDCLGLAPNGMVGTQSPHYSVALSPLEYGCQIEIVGQSEIPLVGAFPSGEDGARVGFVAGFVVQCVCGWLGLGGARQEHGVCMVWHCLLRCDVAWCCVESCVILW